MSIKKQVLSCLKKARLVELSRHYGFTAFGVLTKEDIIQTLSQKRSIKIEDLLSYLKLTELKQISHDLGIDTIALKKDQTISKILDSTIKKTDKPKVVRPKPEHLKKSESKPSKKEPNPIMSTLQTTNNGNGSNQVSRSFSSNNNFQEKANFIWQVADDILRGVFKRHEYGDVILPFVLLRRLDCVFEDCKDEVIKTYEKFKNKIPDPHQLLLKSANGLGFYNTSFYDLRRLAQDAGNIELNFNNYINGYSRNVRHIIENYNLDKIVNKLVKNDLLFMMVDKFTEVDLHPKKVKNHEMGYVFEELLRRFSEMSNETAGEHYTPREVIRLMVNLLFAEHQDELKGKGIIRTVFDPACGTGGMLSIAREHIQKNINPNVEVIMYGQELNEQTFAIATSDVLILGGEADNIRLGSSFNDDKFKGNRFDFMLSNPPFGVSWKKEQDFIKNESSDPNGRFHAGLPRVSDGALLFQQHMISKMNPSGSRIAIIHNGSPLFTGDAGSGESDIRKWIIEKDWLEAIVALPTELFFNTGIATYIWIVTNKKPKHRKGNVQLINAIDFFEKMRKSLGNKRKYISNDQIGQITDIYTGFSEGKYSKIFDNDYFGYTKVTVERPLIENGKVQTDSRGNPKPDTSLRDYEKIPLQDDLDDYFEREVEPHVSDAWMDRSKDKVGYEINFTKYFYEYKPLRSLEEIKADILQLEEETEGLLKEILA